MLASIVHFSFCLFHLVTKLAPAPHPQTNSFLCLYERQANAVTSVEYRDTHVAMVTFTYMVAMDAVARVYYACAGRVIAFVGSFA